MAQSQQVLSRDAPVGAHSPSIYMHAELLPNIRQLTLYVSLSNSSESAPSDEHASTISLSESRRAVTVSLTHKRGNEDIDMTETLKLPARVSGAARASLNFAGHRGGKEDTDGKRTEFSFRLPLDKDEGDVMRNDLDDDDFVPWTADDMFTCTALHCRFCKRVILEKSDSDTTSAWTWKDLPSGNWAEMMDFWHCHKPDPHEHAHEHELQQHKAVEEQTALTKGYGAASQVVAIPGTILVDVASFLVTEGDCQGLKKSQIPPPAPSSIIRVNIECEGCGQILGMEDHIAAGWRLYKANLAAKGSAIQRDDSKRDRDEQTGLLLESHRPETIVSAQLLEMIQREGVRRFVVHAGREDGFLIWVFNPSLRYSSCSSSCSSSSSSSSQHNTIVIPPHHAMKIFYQHIPQIEKLLEPEKGTPAPIFSLEELFLPANIFDEVEGALRRSTDLLPVSARMFREEWEVGFLRRFERKRL